MTDPVSARSASAFKGGISQIFLAIVAVFLAAGVAITMGRGGVFGVFVFVFAGWIVSLCLHEFGHAATAWAGGDKSVAEMGYLTLNPLRYANPLLSIVMPLVFLAVGGIGFPGGAVYVRTEDLRTKAWRTAVSAAGPAMNLLCLIAIGVALCFLRPDTPIAGGLAFLGFLQATAVLLNLLPVPGLDGFGMLQSILPDSEREAFAPISNFVWIAFLITIYAAPELLQPVWQVALKLCGLAGIDIDGIQQGSDLFQFWDPH